MDEMHQKHLDMGDQQLNFEQSMATLATWGFDNPWHLCQVLDSGHAVVHVIADAEENGSPQEANPEGAQSPLQRAAVQAIHDGKEMTCPSSGSLDADFSQVPVQPTSLAERNDAEECIHFHRAPLPVLTPLSMAADVTVTEEQPHFTVEQAVTILTSDSTWSGSTPPQEVNLRNQG